MTGVVSMLIVLPDENRKDDLAASMTLPMVAAVTLGTNGQDDCIGD